MMNRRIRLNSSIALLLLATAGHAGAAHARAASNGAGPHTCEGLPGFDRLDFWLGEWDVFVGGRIAGANRIEKILSGCAIAEHWQGAQGGEGRSLFYYDDVRDVWKQVWVTSNATAPGGLKEKTQIAEGADGSLQFQGEVALADGRSYLDRTTLTPLDEGRVRQLIEISTDGGMTWEARFDGLYAPRTGGGD